MPTDAAFMPIAGGSRGVQWGAPEPQSPDAIVFESTTSRWVRYPSLMLASRENAPLAMLISRETRLPLRNLSRCGKLALLLAVCSRFTLENRIF
jgi:hypothetical protein